MRAKVNQCNNQAEPSFRVNELEIRDFVFTSGHVRRIAGFVVSGTCTRVFLFAARVYASYTRLMHADHYVGDYVTAGLTIGDVCKTHVRACVCARGPQ